MKYAPKRVFVVENGRYIEISYEELCNRSESDVSYKNRRFLPLHGMLMEVDENEYKEFYKTSRRQKYLEELSKENGEFSFDMLTTNDFNGQDILLDTKTDVYQFVEQKIIMDKLQKGISLLTEEEQRLIQEIYYEGLTEREIAKKQGIYHNAVHKKKVRILNKLKKYLEN